MNFVHEDAEFVDLLLIVAERRGLARALVEKDYWVTHTLWSIHQASCGLSVWFKGGTSLSKGFGIIRRFSEDLDLKVESSALPAVSNWKSVGTRATGERHQFFRQLTKLIVVPGAFVELDQQVVDSAWQGANYLVRYPGRYAAELGVISPFVRLEVGQARVAPFVVRPITSLVHEHLDFMGVTDEFVNNRPTAVRCIHPWVTLVEKIDALQRRFARQDLDPASYVRHFEDAANIIQSDSRISAPQDYARVCDLVEDMLARGQIKNSPDKNHPAFAPTAGTLWDAVRSAHAEIHCMYWGPRLSLEEACAEIREWASESQFGR